MPEKFSFAMLVEGPPSLALRRSFLDAAPTCFGRWLKQPREVMLLDPTQSTPGLTLPWSQAGGLLHRELTADELLFVYYEADGEPNSVSVLSVSEGAAKSEFTIALPDMTMEDQPRDVEDRLLDLFRWSTVQSRKCLVVAGGEAGIGAGWHDVPSGIRHAQSDGTVMWLCCDRAHLPGNFATFKVVRAQGAAIVGRWTAPVS